MAVVRTKLVIIAICLLAGCKNAPVEIANMTSSVMRRDKVPAKVKLTLVWEHETNTMVFVVECRTNLNGSWSLIGETNRPVSRLTNGVYEYRYPISNDTRCYYRVGGKYQSN
jgi:hypothetical protein